VTLEELKEGLNKQNSPVTQKEVEGLMQSMDIDASGSIDYEEFLAATVNFSQLQVCGWPNALLLCMWVMSVGRPPLPPASCRCVVCG
jgi:hypothetical protein